jgi:hypothetical protein
METMMKKWFEVASIFVIGARVVGKMGAGRKQMPLRCWPKHVPSPAQVLCKLTPAATQGDKNS